MIEAALQGYLKGKHWQYIDRIKQNSCLHMIQAR